MHIIETLRTCLKELHPASAGGFGIAECPQSCRNTDTSGADDVV